MTKVYWVSRHDMSPAQLREVGFMHGGDVQIVKDSVTFEGPDGLQKYIETNSDGVVYAVATSAQFMWAALNGRGEFGFFENHPARRADGSFGLKAVWFVFRDSHGRGEMRLAYINDDPLSDEGEKLAPAASR